jgi:hypothetical protein
MSQSWSAVSLSAPGIFLSTMNLGILISFDFWRAKPARWSH